MFTTSIDTTLAMKIASQYLVTCDIPYFKTPRFTAKLDVYRPRRTLVSRPAAMFMHHGGWGAKFQRRHRFLWLLPYLQLGWTIINVEYRSSAIAPAPAAVNDCLYALRWVTRNAHQFDIATEQLILIGMSAGGHLALTTRMIPACFPEMRGMTSLVF